MSVSKFLLVGITLCIVMIFGNGQEGEVYSEVDSIINEHVDSGFYPSLDNIREKRSNFRVKRDIKTQHLEDPNSCIENCRRIMSEKVKKAAEGPATKVDEQLEEQKLASFKSAFYRDMCTASEEADACYALCPPSQLKNIFTFYNETWTKLFCEPSRNWANYSEFTVATSCTSSVEAEHPCDKKCKKELRIEDVINLKNNFTDDGMTVTYESDIVDNNRNVKSLCTQMACYDRCFKPLMTKKCGVKAYDLFYRMRKIKLMLPLKILKLLNAVTRVAECKAYQK